MKKTTKTLALLLLGVAVGGNSAQAQQRVVAPAGQAYTIQSVAPANGTSVTYQWFRDGVLIANETGDSYTVPANLAKMANGLDLSQTAGTVFQRVAKSADCMGGVAMSNEVTVYFCELMVNGICWAKANLDTYGRISSNPWDLGSFIQWNRINKYYDPTNPAGAVSGWDATPDYNATWTNSPCPTGWRLPTKQDFQNLINGSNPVGGTWISNQARGLPAGVAGKLLGYNTALCTMTDMTGCIFLPANGYRNNSNGAIANQTNGFYHSSEQGSSILEIRLTITNSTSITAYSDKAIGLMVRCVQDI